LLQTVQDFAIVITPKSNRCSHACAHTRLAILPNPRTDDKEQFEGRVRLILKAEPLGLALFEKQFQTKSYYRAGGLDIE
jgi:hypothetical protein